MRGGPACPSVNALPIHNCTPCTPMHQPGPVCTRGRPGPGPGMGPLPAPPCLSLPRPCPCVCAPRVTAVAGVRGPVPALYLRASAHVYKMNKKLWRWPAPARPGAPPPPSLPPPSSSGSGDLRRRPRPLQPPRAPARCHGPARVRPLTGVEFRFVEFRFRHVLLRFDLPPVRGEPGARPVELSRVMLPSQRHAPQADGPVAARMRRRHRRQERAVGAQRHG